MAEHVPTTPIESSRRRLFGSALALACMPLAARTVAALPSVASPFVASPEHILAGLFFRIAQAEDALHALTEDSEIDAGVERIDALLAEVAQVKPVSDRAYGIKALIASRWGNDSSAGEMVLSFLLFDLIGRGGIDAAFVGSAMLAMPSDGNPDADLIQGCADYIVAVDSYNADGGHTQDERDDPLWHAMMAARTRAEARDPATLSGVLALAQVALNEARQPDGREDFGTGFTGRWPERVVRGVLHVASGGRSA